MIPGEATAILLSETEHLSEEVGSVEATELVARSCVPCRGGIPPLTEHEARRYLAQTHGWALAPEANRIAREFTFRDFREAVAFVNRVADLAEEEGHHPDFQIRGNRVTIVLWTHKIDGLHENDFIMAAKINRLHGG